MGGKYGFREGASMEPMELPELLPGNQITQRPLKGENSMELYPYFFQIVSCPAGRGGRGVNLGRVLSVKWNFFGRI